MIEKWEKIIINNFKTNYSVSTNGQIRNDKTGRFLKQQLNYGYYRVALSLGKGKMKNFKVHRLVAQAFLSNPENKQLVNHIDGDRTNNNLTNLEWCTAKENAIHAHRTGLVGHQRKRAVRQYNLEGKWMMDFISIIEAANQCNCQQSKISDVCCGNRKTAGGYQWRYVDNNLIELPPVQLPSCTKKKVAQYDMNNNLIAIYESYKEAAKAVNGTSSAISRICSGAKGLHTHKGFKWKIVDDIVQEKNIS